MNKMTNWTAETLMRDIYARIPHSLTNGDVGYSEVCTNALPNMYSGIHSPAYYVADGIQCEENVYIDLFLMTDKDYKTTSIHIGSIYYKNFTGKADNEFYCKLFPAVSEAFNDVIFDWTNRT